MLNKIFSLSCPFGFCIVIVTHAALQMCYTCFWQIEDRSDNGDFDNMVNKDLRYIDEWSLWLDVKLFFRTIPAVLFRKGAK